MYLEALTNCAVEHDEFDIHDNMRVNICHKNKLLCMTDVHDKKWSTEMREKNSG